MNGVRKELRLFTHNVAGMFQPWLQTSPQSHAQQLRLPQHLLHVEPSWHRTETSPPPCRRLHMLLKKIGEQIQLKQKVSLISLIAT